MSDLDDVEDVDDGHVVLSTITVRLVATDAEDADNGLQVLTTADPDPQLVQALGMLDLARDTLLRWYEDDTEEES